MTDERFVWYGPWCKTCDSAVLLVEEHLRDDPYPAVHEIKFNDERGTKFCAGCPPLTKP